MATGKISPLARDQYQTVKELADRVRVGEATVRCWVKNGELRAIDIGKGCRNAEAFLFRHATTKRESVPMAPTAAVVANSGEDLET